MPTSIDFTYTRALFNLFRNVNVNVNYRNLRECRLQVSHVSVICRHGRYSELSRTALLCCRLALLAITKYIYNQSEKELILKRKTGLAYYKLCEGVDYAPLQICSWVDPENFPLVNNGWRKELPSYSISRSILPGKIVELRPRCCFAALSPHKSPHMR